MRTEDLRVQALKNPLGINENPVFSWQLVSDKKDEKNERQTAYRRRSIDTYEECEYQSRGQRTC